MKLSTIHSCGLRTHNNFTLIRLIAALLVIYGHSYPIVGSTHPDLILQLLQSKYAGDVAVDIFFTISGYLICASWVNNTWIHFITARISRIYPALIVCTFLTVIIGFLISTQSAYFLQKNVWSYLFYNTSLVGVRFNLPSVFETHPYVAVNGSLWTLPHEIKLYVGTALLGSIGLLSSKRYWILCIGAGLAYLLSYLNLFHIDRFWGLATFFGAGAFCWIYRKSIILSAPILILMIIGCIAFYKSEKFIYFYFLALVYGTFYLVYVPQIKWQPSKDLSYGVYLYGWPIQQLVLHFVPGCTAEFNAAMSIVIALVCGYLSWTYVEAPALALRKKLSFK